MHAPQQPEPPVVRRRGPEIAVASVLALLAVLDIVDSLRVGIGWADDGPQAGYFPFYIGLVLLAASVFIGAAELWRGDGQNQVFAERSQIAQVFAVFVPTLVYVALIYPFGLYVPSAVLIGYFMRRYGYSVAAAALANILGRGLESNLRSGLQLTENDPIAFVTRPAAAVILLLALTIATIGVIQSQRARRRVKDRQAEAGP